MMVTPYDHIHGIVKRPVFPEDDLMQAAQSVVHRPVASVGYALLGLISILSLPLIVAFLFFHDVGRTIISNTRGSRGQQSKSGRDPCAEGHPER